MALAVCPLLCTAIHLLKQPVASADHAGVPVAMLGVVAGVGVRGHVVAGGATGGEFAVGNRLDLKRGLRCADAPGAVSLQLRNNHLSAPSISLSLLNKVDGKGNGPRRDILRPLPKPGTCKPV
jgi:hypothetical protein